MRNLITTLAAGAALVALGAPARAETAATSSSAAATQSYRYDCYRGESFSECRRRIQQEQQRSQYQNRYQYGYDYNRYQYNPYDYGRYDYGRGYDQNRYDPYRYGYDNRYGSGYDYGYGRYYDGGVSGETALALSILGTALGVNILGTYDDRSYYDRYRYDDNWRRWCSQRYNSFDWRSGTYMHSDGYRRYCRMY